MFISISIILVSYVENYVSHMKLEQFCISKYNGKSNEGYKLYSIFLIW